ncbi:hypothetical protein C8Q79DRAFT_927148 [Trametes meyenii]|nr:hypothetical protein C8Q79DRAFT_927148 [Trametes meyenii]
MADTYAGNMFRGENYPQNSQSDSAFSTLSKRGGGHHTTIAKRTSPKENATPPRRSSCTPGPSRSGDQTWLDDSASNAPTASNVIAVLDRPSSEHSLTLPEIVPLTDVPLVPQAPPYHCKRVDSPIPEASTDNPRTGPGRSTASDDGLAMSTHDQVSMSQPPPWNERPQMRLVPVMVFMNMTQAEDEDAGDSEPPPYQPRPGEPLS